MDEILKSTDLKMRRTVEILKEKYSQINVGRPTPALLNGIFVDYYGVPTKISQLASISVSGANKIVINPFDSSTLSEIERAISTSKLGLLPQNDGKIVFIFFPPPTEEKRKIISKNVSKDAENTRISIRNIRRDSLAKLKKMNKNSQITEDFFNVGQNKVQNLTNKYIKEVDEVLNFKQKDIMTI
ncbi:MAG: ribosome recycling factor [Oscillospiraceae bacterium]|jgi:ribosome recycling factor|nr:ribosome recycling factor [Oscillospiraceae bacterium]